MQLFFRMSIFDSRFSSTRDDLCIIVPSAVNQVSTGCLTWVSEYYVPCPLGSAEQEYSAIGIRV